MRPILLLFAVRMLFAAEVCPHPASDAEVNSWTAKLGRRSCVANAVSAKDTVEWPAAGIVQAKVAERIEFAICCYSKEAAKDAILRIGAKERTVATHAELPHKSEDDETDFPDLIEDDAHIRSASIRGTLGTAPHPVRVDITLRASASKFADLFAIQFSIINRSADKVAVSWDHLRELESHVHPAVQPIAGGKTWVFLVKATPVEAIATVELKTPSGESLGRFQFDGWK